MKFHIFIFIFLSVTVWAGESYRLLIDAVDPKRPAFIDTHSLVLPGNLKSGVTVTAEDGTKLASFLAPNGNLLIAPYPKSKRRIITWGGNGVHKTDNWSDSAGVRPAAHRLGGVVYQGKHICTSEEFFERRIRDLNRREQSTFRYLTNRLEHILMLKHTQGALWRQPENARIRGERQRRQRLNLLSRKKWEQRQAVISALQPAWWPEIPYEARDFKRVFENHCNTVKRERKRYDDQRLDLKRRTPLGQYEDLRAISRWWKREPYEFEMLWFRDLPVDLFRYFSVWIKSDLLVPRNGFYEYEITTNGLTIFSLDGEELCMLSGNGAGITKTRTIGLEQKAGAVNFEVFYRVNAGEQIHLKIRRRELPNGEFKVLRAEDFVPAPPGTPVELQSERGRYPLVGCFSDQLWSIDKWERVEMTHFSLLNAAEEPIVFLCDGERKTLPPLIAVPVGKATPWAFGGNGLLTLPIPAAEPPSYREAEDAEVEMSFWVPDFLYYEEKTELVVELRSRLPIATEVLLEYGQEEAAPIVLRPGERKKISFSLDTGNREHVFRVSLPGVELAKRTLLILPVTENLSVVWQAGEGFVSKEGARVVYGLSRPTLAEQRSWELPRKLQNYLGTASTLLFLGEDWGTFRKDLENGFLARNKIVLFESLSGRELINGMIPAVRSKILESKADMIFILLPSFDRIADLEPWRRERALAALLTLCRANRTFRQTSIVLMPDREGNEADLQEWREELYRLRREYDFSFYDLARFNVLSSDAFFLNQQETSRYPIAWGAKIAELVVKIGDKVSENTLIDLKKP